VPRQLKAAPFTLAEARRHGLTLESLKGKAWKRLGSELYCWRGGQEDPWRLLAAWARLVPPKAIFAGKTAAWILGLDFEPANPVEIAVPTASTVRSRAGLNLRRCDIRSRDVRAVRGLRTTTLHRTLRDLSATWPSIEALVAIDMSLHLRLTDATALLRYTEDAKGRPGVSRLRSLAELAAPAESPMETRLRWLLLEARLPRPEVQADLHDRDSRFVGRADLYYPSSRLVLEYDGGNHRDRLVTDDRRQNLLINAGFRVLRFTASDVHQHPNLVVAQVRESLATAPPSGSTRLAPNPRELAGDGAWLAPNRRNRTGVELAQHPTW
jgi:very-short-patch-repair endonuclease